jgi:glutamine amidotransferase
MIIIVDYNLGNLGSVFNMLKYLNIKSQITSDRDKIWKADKLILSGVGSFDNGIQNLISLGLKDILQEKVLSRKTPILGICLGMQLMSHRSDEGNEIGLDWIDAETERFDSKNLPVPHMMWNYVKTVSDSKLLLNLDCDARFYFAHSYFLKCNNPDIVVALTAYGNEFVSVIEQENILGVQFHPEKSHKYGMKLLSNFASEY